jgi:hypothetical protein
MLAILLTYGLNMAQQQILFEGLVSQGEGTAGWNADGTGPEPAATGHLVPAPGFAHQYYYGSSADYITQNPAHAAFHLLPGMTGFPLFALALADNGFTPEQVKVTYGLCTLGDDIEGLDWFFMNNWAFSNYYNNYFKIQLNGEPMLAGYCNYSQMYINTISGNWLTETAYTPVTYNAQLSSPEVMLVAQAFLDDLNGAEIIIKYESTYGSAFSGNGRSGAYYNILNGILEVGNPQLPFQGLNADHEGFAGWDADGTGLEPYGNGHLTQLYYGASLDYDNIDPDPSACLGHFLDGSTGFFNTELQLQYRGFEIGDLKMKLGLESLGPDVQGEDWGYQNGYHWCNYYNNAGIIELNGEPILAMMQDTNRLLATSSHWTNETSIGKVYNISQYASPEAQFVAQSFLKDVGSHYLKTIGSNIQYHSMFSGNGRDGALYEIEEGALMGVNQKATFIPEGSVSGVWELDNSPYFIDGNLSIENGQTLTIEPGVEVEVRGPYHIDVQGTILAEGTADENILFTRSNPNLWWDGIDFDNTLLENDSSKFDYCKFSYGYAQSPAPANSGGAMAIWYFDKVSVTNSVFEFNKADISSPPWTPSGGALAIFGCDPIIQKCIFRDNKATDAAAIIIYSNANPVISNCLFNNNMATSDAGAIEFNTGSNGILINNTFADNHANYGGAVQVKTNSNPLFINSIFWGNEADDTGNQVQIEDTGSQPGFYYCDVEGGLVDFGGIIFTGDYLFNIESDPFFSGDSEFPYSLLDASSPCWNAGTPDTSAWYYPQYLPETCLCGAPRIADGCVDIGAYELLVTGIIPLQDNDAIVAEIYPNPFANHVRLDFQLQEPGMVRIDLLDLYGRQLAIIGNEWREATNHRISFNASDLSAGIYFCRIQIGNETITKKIIKVQ